MVLQRCELYSEHEESHFEQFYVNSVNNQENFNVF
jgi:hypothetical protein